MKRTLRVVAAVAVLMQLWIGKAYADADELIPCHLLIAKTNSATGQIKFICKPPPGESFVLPSPGASPVPGGALVFGVAPVPPGNFGLGGLNQCKALGQPAGSQGYKCHLPGHTTLLLRPNVIKVIDIVDVLAHPVVNDIAIQFESLGPSDMKRYCAKFPVATALRNDNTQFKVKNAPAPAVCQ